MEILDLDLEKMEILKQRLIYDIERYQRNKSLISEEEQKTKYKGALDALKRKIKENLRIYAQISLTTGFCAPWENMSEINKIVNTCGKEISTYVFKKYDLASAEQTIIDARFEIFKKCV